MKNETCCSAGSRFLNPQKQSKFIAERSIYICCLIYLIDPYIYQRFIRIRHVLITNQERRWKNISLTHRQKEKFSAYSQDILLFCVKRK